MIIQLRQIIVYKIVAKQIQCYLDQLPRKKIEKKTRNSIKLYITSNQKKKYNKIISKPETISNPIYFPCNLIVTQSIQIK